MKLLGIKLKSPDALSLIVTAFLGIIIIGIVAPLISAAVLTLNNGVAIATGLIGGSLANAYGVSVKNSGWRGGILSGAFSLGLMASVRFLMSLSN